MINIVRDRMIGFLRATVREHLDGERWILVGERYGVRLEISMFSDRILLLEVGDGSDVFEVDQGEHVEQFLRQFDSCALLLKRVFIGPFSVAHCLQLENGTEFPVVQRHRCLRPLYREIFSELGPPHFNDY